MWIVRYAIALFCVPKAIVTGDVVHFVTDADLPVAIDGHDWIGKIFGRKPEVE